MSATSTLADLRRGACPSLPAPMLTGDGLLARLALAAPLTPDQAIGLAGLAGELGNGLVEVTARGKLQLRGLEAEGAVRLPARVAALGIAVADGLAIETSPLAARDPTAALDPRPIAAALAAAVATRGLEARLAPKVSLGVEGGGRLSLAGRDLDLRLVPVAGVWRIEAAGVVLGLSADPVPAVVSLMERLAALGPRARMRDLLARDGAASLSAGLESPGTGAALPSEAAEPLGRHPLAEGLALGLGLPFGQSEASALAALADAARQAGASFLEPAGARALLIGPLTPEAADGLAQGAAALGFLTRADDPLRRVSACAGAPACGSARMETRALARQLAPLSGGRSLHVSGCVKGCAHPSVADLTLVGLDEGAGIVIEGTPRDTPARILPHDGLAAAARELLETTIG